jgi:HEAT repeat protein
LIKVLSDPVQTVRLAAINALGSIGPAASAAVPSLVAIIDDRTATRFMVRSSMLALGEMGSAAKAALPAVRRLAQERPDSTAADTILLIEGKVPDTYF